MCTSYTPTTTILMSITNFAIKDYNYEDGNKCKAICLLLDFVLLTGNTRTEKQLVGVLSTCRNENDLRYS